MKDNNVKSYLKAAGINIIAFIDNNKLIYREFIPNG